MESSENVYFIMQNFQPKGKLNQWQVSLLFLWYYETSRATILLFSILLFSSLMGRKACHDQTISMAYCFYFSGECCQLVYDCCPLKLGFRNLRNKLHKNAVYVLYFVQT